MADTPRSVLADIARLAAGCRPQARHWRSLKRWLEGTVAGLPMRLRKPAGRPRGRRPLSRREQAFYTGVLRCIDRLVVEGRLSGAEAARQAAATIGQVWDLDPDATAKLARTLAVYYCTRNFLEHPAD